MGTIRRAACVAAASCAITAGIAVAPAGAHTALMLGGTGGGALTPGQIAAYVHPEWVQTYQGIAYPGSLDFRRSIATGLESLKASMGAPKPIVLQGISQGARSSTPTRAS
ncbi:Uncharacterised protein [Mycolicibacterium phlei]|uniref:hypothetical protein n=1 Tax=Mycolicibacterium phlei TaxID=1771 RepID=UPI00025AD1F9|nr:hypothetical protein [Mycolicibacterium phlei]VEG11454.1 Uncharacterised protein [Mycobacteroides chelonae]AMO63358.1 hypothetical protein MPHLCCUG_04572 [Mycolicibacterium phlei]EID16021.1 hypothetical protein MPHLEI_06077 [Mycolicibacterium phlei RIVM601174]KXW64146.1 hypothetical protein MPHL43072_06160 [Mycolicibacterium phlei DSM 43072]KXW74472.1 hypothetical protein MPHL43070_00500 [Mycolicibacterium phlei DSM 43070]